MLDPVPLAVREISETNWSRWCSYLWLPRQEQRIAGFKQFWDLVGNIGGRQFDRRCLMLLCILVHLGHSG